MALKAFLAVTAFALSLAPGATGRAAETPPAREWTFQGIFGTFDRAAAQRGLQVYREGCAACHSLDLLYYRNLEALGYGEEEIQAIAAEHEVTDGPDEEGEMFERPARPSDRFVAPFPNPQAARAANNGALPPDLSLITKARAGGPDYLFALLTGYQEEPPEGVEFVEGMYYNEYFPGRQIAMPPPLFDDAVEYADGTPATVEQMARDVVTFLSWAAEPEMEERKRLGIKVILFLVVLTGLFYAVKRKVWSDVH
ncbi:MAG: cytochrome c1 [Proteobacteria bacterium]|nr:cytochrome c1 [Pseudomonadota bacterium]